jgi:uncharacterized protein (DUF433 family)
MGDAMPLLDVGEAGLTKTIFRREGRQNDRLAGHSGDRLSWRRIQGGATMPTTTDHFTKTAAVCGGDACIRGHRIPVWVPGSYRRLGVSDADLLRAYPALTAADLQAAWEYAAANAEETDRAIHENEHGEEGFVE